MRARSALAAGLAAAVLLTAGALWMQDRLYDNAMAAARAQAQDELVALIGAVGQGGEVTGTWGAFPYQVVAGDGRIYAASSPDIAPFDVDGRTALPPPGAGVPGATEGPSSVRFGTPPGTRDNPLAGHTFPVISSDVSAAQAGADDPHSLIATLPSDAIIRVYVVVTPFQAGAAVTAVDPVLLPAVPLGVLLVLAVAYLTTRRALRPVEAIRRRTAAVTAADPRERVDVPDTGDEIAALAVTINATLQRLDDAASAQRRLVADAAHELRSPLTVLLADLEVALAYPDRADWPTTTAAAAGQARRLQALIEDLLLLARLDEGQQPRRSRLDLAALATELTGEYAAAARERAVELSCVTDGPAPVLGSPGRLRRVLRNLLDNALRHADTEIRVSVRAGDGSGPVLLEVADDGPGIEPADHERVFERFTRLADARDRDSGGTGLGLAIARDLARRQQGSLALAPGGGPGARFVLTLDPAPDHQDADGQGPNG
ncbi:HAMP domain-containing histidine kinase [Streptacidiphilus sp. P02-A3a]|nr:HAMP domain-containing histidine kinase [Streptacidiphilus sp. P02-A3a]